MADMVEGLAKTAFKKRGFAESRMLADWPSIVGPMLAKVSQPQSLNFPVGLRDNGTLCIRVDAGGWATEIQHLEPIILDKIATYFGYRAVARLSITQAPLPRHKKQDTSNPRAPSRRVFADS